ncbi:MAG: N-acetyl-gamma-glutamyl-phosphate reductase [Thermacetogeniaceae bacterium]|jgi:N-acetyl-gamma-glutamyl-phosphate reductase|nr:N-acetyl-gamma-glutamyl-phosphate reductase [Syntrophomonadaceae bacterium]
MALRVGIVGVTGYVGEELVRILCHHPEVSEITAASKDFAGTALDRVYPHLRGHAEIEIMGMEDLGELIGRSDVVFLALPHRVSAPVAQQVIEKGKKVIDLAADFRLPEQKVYEEWYQVEHGAPALLKEAVYGLPELFREEIKGKRLVANPGCYPTSALLALAPLLKKRLVDRSSVIIDSKSGVSGAGRSLKLGSLFAECNENMKAYGLGTHRHTPEITHYAGVLAGEAVDIIFTPHLMPVSRGIISTVYAKLSSNLDSCSLRQIYQDFYADEEFVHVALEGEMPETKWVVGTNRCFLGAVVNREMAVVVSVIDNLVKGAAGQAVQNMNLLFELPENTGLQQLGLYP